MTRAYFTAATCAISLKKSLGVITSSTFFSKLNILYYTTNSTIYRDNLTSINKLIIWNKKLGFSSMFNKQKLTKIEKNIIQLTPRVKSIIIGLILSDGWIQKNGNWNPRIGFKQSIVNFPYFWEVYNELAYLCSGLPMWGKVIKRGKIFFSIAFQTRQLDCLNEIFNLFFKSNNVIRTKTIKPELFFYLDNIALAHWIMGDGSKRKNGLILCTDNFSLQEIVLLVNILIIKFDIYPTIQKEKDKFRIYINKKNLIKIKPLILPYFVNHFLYKI